MGTRPHRPVGPQRRISRSAKNSCQTFAADSDKINQPKRKQDLRQLRLVRSSTSDTNTLSHHGTPAHSFPGMALSSSSGLAGLATKLLASNFSPHPLSSALSPPEPLLLRAAFQISLTSTSELPAIHGIRLLLAPPPVQNLVQPPPSSLRSNSFLIGNSSHV